ncbi:MAG: FapA family protein [Candidatus Hydrogenedentota bacterium]
MGSEIVIEAESIKEALKKGAEKFGIASRYLDYKIIERGRNGFLGFFKKSWKILVYEKEIELHDLRGVSKALETARNLDGYFDIKFEGVNIYATVYPAKGMGKEVNAQAILHYLKGIEVEEVDNDAVSKAVLFNLERPVLVGKRKIIPDADSYAKIELSADHMQAYITVIPPEGAGKDLTKVDIINTLHREGVIFGIKEDVIDDLLKEKVYNTRTLIAEGTLPINGVNAKIELRFESDKTLPKFRQDKFGRIDLREMNLIEVVKKGDPVAEKISAQKGIPGKKIDGRMLPAKDGIEIPIKHGDGIVFDKNTNKFIADKDGQPIIKNGKIEIEELLTIKGDVNYSTGNIDFIGTVIVNGNIEDNFRVTAKGDVIVKKNIGNSFVKAGQDVKVIGGIIGKEKGVVQAERDIFAKFVEQAILTAKRNIVITELCFHSHIDSGYSVVLPGKRGQIIGGVIRAAKHVISKEIGAAGSPHTKIAVGIDPSFFDELQNYQLKFIETIDLIKKLEEGLSRLEKLKNSSRWDKTFEREYDEINKSLIELKKREKDLHNLIYQSKEKIGKEKDASISAMDKIHIGAHMEINKLPFIVSKQEYQYVTFKGGKDMVEFVPFQSSLLDRIFEHSEE